MGFCIQNEEFCIQNDEFGRLGQATADDSRVLCRCEKGTEIMNLILNMRDLMLKLKDFMLKLRGFYSK